MATLTEHMATLTAKLRNADPVSLRFRRGTGSVVVVAANGKDLRWPYAGQPVAPVGKRFWLPKPLTINNVPIIPREGDVLETTDRRFELVALGDDPPAAPGNADSAWRVNALDVTDAPRRDTILDIEIPDPEATRAASGNKDKTAHVIDTASVYATVTPESATETGSQAQMDRTFRVVMAARHVRGSARFAVRSGWLEDGRKADEAAERPNTPERVYLYVQSVTRDSASALEVTCLCRCVGG